jgi:hypothetical protein
MNEVQFLNVLRNAGVTYLSDALEILTAAQRLSTNSPDFSTHEGRVAFAKTDPTIQACLPDRKIQAIKEMRTVASAALGATLSLLDAKNAIDAVSPPRY